MQETIKNFIAKHKDDVVNYLKSLSQNQENDIENANLFKTFCNKKGLIKNCKFYEIYDKLSEEKKEKFLNQIENFFVEKFLNVNIAMTKHVINKHFLYTRGKNRFAKNEKFINLIKEGTTRKYYIRKNDDRVSIIFKYNRKINKNKDRSAALCVASFDGCIKTFIPIKNAVANYEIENGEKLNLKDYEMIFTNLKPETKCEITNISKKIIKKEKYFEEISFEKDERIDYKNENEKRYYVGNSIDIFDDLENELSRKQSQYVK